MKIDFMRRIKEAQNDHDLEMLTADEIDMWIRRFNEMMKDGVQAPEIPIAAACIYEIMDDYKKVFERIAPEEMKDDFDETVAAVREIIKEAKKAGHLGVVAKLSV